MSTSLEDVKTGLPEELTESAIEGCTKVAEDSRGAAPASILTSFKNRNFTLLFSGQAISSIGDALYAVALPFLIFNHGGSARELGIVLTAYGIPRVASVLLGGWLSDRLRPRRLMLLADAIRALLVGMLAALAFGTHLDLWQLCAISCALGAFQGLFLPASFSILPEIQGEDDLQAGNALLLVSTQATMLIGSALAGILVSTLHSGPALAIDALTFVVSAITLFLMRSTLWTPNQAAQSERDEDRGVSSATIATEPINFGRFLLISPLVRVAFLVAIVGSFCLGGLSEVALPTLANSLMQVGASGYGLIMMGFGAGALAGSIFAGTMSKMPHKGLIGLLVVLIEGVAVALVPYGGFAGAVFLVFTVGVVSSFANTLLMTVIQLNLPRHLLGRVMGIFLFASFGCFPISVALAGVLVDRFGPALLFPFGGFALILSVFLGLMQKGLREL